MLDELVRQWQSGIVFWTDMENGMHLGEFDFILEIFDITDQEVIL